MFSNQREILTMKFKNIYQLKKKQSKERKNY